MTVLDTSAVLALLRDEPGADAVAAALPSSALSAANLAEVVGELVDLGLNARRLRGRLLAAGVAIEPLTSDDADLAGTLRSLSGGRSLSLGDRCCIALVALSRPTEVLTADRVWADLDLPIAVRLIR